MTPRISILLPTRGRPHCIARLTQSLASTLTGEAEVVLYLDEDDPQADYAAGQMNLWASTRMTTHTIRGPRVVLSECWNRCAEVAQADVMMHCGDDIVFRTPGWDGVVLDAFAQYPDHIVFVHGRDGYHDAALGTHGFLHRAWVDAVGYFVPPLFSSDYNDTWLTHVADQLDRRQYLAEVYTEHMHPALGKGEWDQTHRERIARGEVDDVAALYARTADQRDRDVARLRQAIQEAAV